MLNISFWIPRRLQVLSSPKELQWIGCLISTFSLQTRLSPMNQSHLTDLVILVKSCPFCKKPVFLLLISKWYDKVYLDQTTMQPYCWTQKKAVLTIGRYCAAKHTQLFIQHLKSSCFRSFPNETKLYNTLRYFLFGKPSDVSYIAFPSPVFNGASVLKFSWRNSNTLKMNIFTHLCLQVVTIHWRHNSQPQGQTVVEFRGSCHWQSTVFVWHSLHWQVTSHHTNSIAHFAG